VLDVEAAQLLLDRSPFGPWWGFVVRSVRPGLARVDLPARPEFYRPGGVLQGGCAMTLADVTCWIAILAATGADSGAVTLHQSSDFLAAARTGLTCESSLLRTGRTVLCGTASTWDTAGTLVSHHTITYLRPNSGSAAAVKAGALSWDILS
jgi:uncharacterized protein (TIGR00369 family)